MTIPFPSGRVDPLRSLTWRGVAICAAFCAALSLWSWSGILLLPNKTLTFAEHAEYFLTLFQRNLVTFFPIYLTVAIADGMPLQGGARKALLGAALVVGALLSVQARCGAVPYEKIYLYGVNPVPYCASFPTWKTYFDFPGSLISPLVTSTLVLVFVLGRRRDAELAAALHRTRTAQIESRRQRIESDLEAMHARIDPAALTGTLKAIRDRYEENLEDGEATLDALIERLRHAARHPSVEPGAAT